jgi:hypothetical protein
LSEQTVSVDFLRAAQKLDPFVRAVYNLPNLLNLLNCYRAPRLVSGAAYKNRVAAGQTPCCFDYYLPFSIPFIYVAYY